MVIRLFIKLRILLFFILSMTAMSCNRDQNIVEIKDENNKVVEKYFVDPKINKKEGKYERYFPSGNLAETAYYKRDTLDGERIFYFESGQVERVQNYLFGVFQGEFKSYYINGNLNAQGNYLNNEMDGVWKRFYDSGELMEEVNFVNNDENGPFREYFKNGKLKTEGSYINGPFENGELKEYNESGEVIRTMSCQSGICNTTWVKK